MLGLGLCKLIVFSRFMQTLAAGMQNGLQLQNSSPNELTQLAILMRDPPANESSIQEFSTLKQCCFGGRNPLALDTYCKA